SAYNTLIYLLNRFLCDCYHIGLAQPSVSLPPLKSDGALGELMETTMTTHMRMLSSLALTAATLVTLSSDALAKFGSFSAMRVYSVARTPGVVTRVRTTTSTAAVRKQTVSAATHTTSTTSHTSSSATKTSSKTIQALANPSSNPSNGNQGNGNVEVRDHRTG